MSRAVAKAKPVDELREVLDACTPRQRELLELLPLHRGQVWACAAALKIGSASVSRWVREPRFIKARELMQAIALDAIGVNAASVLGEVARVAFGDPRKLYDPTTGALKKITDMDDEAIALVAGVDVEEIKGEKGIVLGYTTKVKRYDKLKALELLGRNKRLWGEDKPPAPPVEGPGLTVVIEQRVAANGSGAVAAGQVIVKLQPPE